MKKLFYFPFLHERISLFCCIMISLVLFLSILEFFLDINDNLKQ